MSAHEHVQCEVMNVSRAPAGSFCVTAGLIIHHVQIWFGNARSWFQTWEVAALGGVIVGLQACECGIRTCGSTNQRQAGVRGGCLRCAYRTEVAVDIGTLAHCWCTSLEKVVGRDQGCIYAFATFCFIVELNTVLRGRRSLFSGSGVRLMSDLHSL